MSTITDIILKVDRSLTKGSNLRELVSQTSDRPLEIWRGNGRTIRVGIYRDSTTPDSLADMASVTVQFQESRTSASAFAVETVTAGSITDTITDAGFAAGSVAHFEVTFSDADMNPSLDGAATKTFWCVVYGIDDEGNERTFGAGSVVFHEDGSGASPGAPGGGGTAITSTEAAGLIQSTLGKVYQGTIASGAQVGTIAFGETLSLPATPCVGVIGAYQSTGGEVPHAVAIVPGSLTTTQVQVRCPSASHAGIVVRVLVAV